MNPHFIFNALNNIQGFVVSDQKEKTVQQLQLFSDLMRQTLNNSENETISLDKEIAYLKLYVNFEKQRFKNPIDFIMEVPGEAEAILIPPMMIQPLIENAFKHAGLQNRENARIVLRVTEDDHLLHVEVSDNGKGIDTSSGFIKASHAFSIIRSRIQLLFEAANREMKPDYFQVISPERSGTSIRFSLPLQYKF
jgi:LytS/YehU family sensor histidine kinase